MQRTFSIVSDTNEQIAYLVLFGYRTIIKGMYKNILEHEADILKLGNFTDPLIKNIRTTRTGLQTLFWRSLLVRSTVPGCSI